MDLLQIQYIVAMVESGSVTEAAEKMFVSQSALSLSYKKLERELGVSIFQKQGRRLVLTSAGEVFYDKAKEVLSSVAELRQSMRKIASEREKKVLVCSEAVDYTNEAIRLYARIYPDVFYQIIRANTEDIRAMLQSQTVDFAVTLSPDFGPENEAVLLLDEPMLLAVSAESQYANRDTISLHEIENECVITLQGGLAINRLFESYFEFERMQYKKKMEVNDPETIVLQVGKGLGLGFIPQSVANLNSITEVDLYTKTRAIPIAEPICRRQIYLVTARNRHIKKPVQGFMDFLILFGEYIAQNKSYPSGSDVPDLLNETRRRQTVF